MNKGIPIAVQQIVESMLDKNTNAHTRFNQSQVVESIRDYCDKALNILKKQESKKAIR